MDVERNLRSPLAGIANMAQPRRSRVSRRRRSACAPATRRRKNAARFPTPSGGDPHHHAGIALPAADVGRGGEPAHRRYGDRRRDPRARPDQARGAPGTFARTPAGNLPTGPCSASASLRHSGRSRRWRTSCAEGSAEARCSRTQTQLSDRAWDIRRVAANH